jgi:hypothetical protein
MRRLLVIVTLVLAFAPGCEDRPDEAVRGRSGFWTSSKPAEGGAYRWRLLGIGVGLIGITGFVMMRMVKKANADREKRQSRDAKPPE